MFSTLASSGFLSESSFLASEVFLSLVLVTSLVVLSTGLSLESSFLSLPNVTLSVINDSKPVLPSLRETDLTSVASLTSLLSAVVLSNVLPSAHSGT